MLKHSEPWPRTAAPPVIAVEVVQPAAFLHQLDGPWGVEPGGITVQTLVLLPLAAFEAALVGPLRVPVIIVVHTLPGLRFAQTVPWDGQKASVSSHRNELKLNGGSADIWCRIRSVPRRNISEQSLYHHSGTWPSLGALCSKKSSSGQGNCCWIVVQHNPIHYKIFSESNNSNGGKKMTEFN